MEAVHYQFGLYIYCDRNDSIWQVLSDVTNTEVSRHASVKMEEAL
jgi:hypothetical protein